MIIFPRTRAAAVLMLVVASMAEAATEGVTIATFNIHYIAPAGEGPHMAHERSDGSAGDAGSGSDWGGALGWKNRRDAVVRTIAAAQAHIIAFQEMESFARGPWNPENVQQDYLAEHFPGYAWGATGEPPAFPNTQPVMYREDRFTEVDKGFFFFFSGTPDLPFSQSWAGRFPVFASWTLLEERAGTQEPRPDRGHARLYVYNVHFDAGSRENRRRAARLVLERVQRREHPGAPVIILGDFNAPCFFYPVELYRDAGFWVSDASGSTYHFNRGLDLLPAIDHILVSPDLKITETRVDRRRYEGTFPSDHYLVAAEVERVRQRPRVAAGRGHPVY
ncbi:MAG: endonuclease/exonuclease/phosphatase family protein [bacterium]